MLFESGLLACSNVGGECEGRGPEPIRKPCGYAEQLAVSTAFTLKPVETKEHGGEWLEWLTVAAFTIGGFVLGYVCGRME